MAGWVFQREPDAANPDGPQNAALGDFVRAAVARLRRRLVIPITMAEIMLDSWNAFSRASPVSPSCRKSSHAGSTFESVDVA